MPLPIPRPIPFGMTPVDMVQRAARSELRLLVAVVDDDGPAAVGRQKINGSFMNNKSWDNMTRCVMQWECA